MDERARVTRGRRRRARMRRRGGPLPRRRTDHAEDLVAWLLTSLGLLALLGSVLVGRAATRPPSARPALRWRTGPPRHGPSASVRG